MHPEKTAVDIAAAGNAIAYQMFEFASRLRCNLPRGTYQPISRYWADGGGFNRWSKWK